jgi:hypothetical protein
MARYGLRKSNDDVTVVLHLIVGLSDTFELAGVFEIWGEPRVYRPRYRDKREQERRKLYMREKCAPCYQAPLAVSSIYTCNTATFV